MVAVKAYYDGQAFIPVSPVHAEKNQAAIITILDNEVKETNKKTYLQFAGSLTDERFQELTEILESARAVDENEW
ncbi:hypothetical protein AGMMS49940_18900 [Spirochaetia bacterium]|nr:hypothetical protein AGMMS49940_18900 [Spirochaetia bacterium]